MTQGLSAGLREMMWCPFSPSSISSGNAASFDTIQVSFGLLSGRLAAHPGRRHPPDTVIMLNCASRCERISCSWRDNVRRTIKARARHRLHVVDESFKDQTLAARKLFADNLPEDYRTQSSSLRRTTLCLENVLTATLAAPSKSVRRSSILLRC